MPRSVLAESNIHPAIRDKVSTHQQSIVKEVQAAVAANSVVVVGMGMNPFPKKSCKLLDGASIAYKYLEYGNYFNTWRERNALKMWTDGTWSKQPVEFSQIGSDRPYHYMGSGKFFVRLGDALATEMAELRKKQKR